MTYYIAKTIKKPFDKAVDDLRAALAAQGFGILTDIDIAQTMKAKLGIDHRPYRILGACNPPLAHKALEAEDKIGTMLPCNVIVQERPDGTVEVAAIDPTTSMERVGNPALAYVARTVREKLSAVIASM